MPVYARKLRLITTLSLVIFVVSLLASSVLAQDAGGIAHQVLRRKILHEAGDRYDVRFLTTHTDRVSGSLRAVTGRGRFRRRGKNAQGFTYHATVNMGNYRTRDVGYDLP